MNSVFKTNIRIEQYTVVNGLTKINVKLYIKAQQTCLMYSWNLFFMSDVSEILEKKYVSTKLLTFGVMGLKITTLSRATEHVINGNLCIN